MTQIYIFYYFYNERGLWYTILFVYHSDNFMKRKILAILLLTILCLSACSKDSSNDATTSTTKSNSSDTTQTSKKNSTEDITGNDKNNSSEIDSAIVDTIYANMSSWEQKNGNACIKIGFMKYRDTSVENAVVDVDTGFIAIYVVDDTPTVDNFYISNSALVLDANGSVFQQIGSNQVYYHEWNVNATDEEKHDLLMDIYSTYVDTY